MTTLLHVTGEGHEPLPPFAGHLVQNLEWHRYSPESVDSAVDTVVVSPVSPAEAAQLVLDLRGAGREQAVVLFVDSSPGWLSVQNAFDDVSLVDGLDALRALLEVASSNVDLAEPPPVPVDEERARRHVPRGGTRGMLLARLGDQTGRVGRQDDAAAWASLVDVGGGGGGGADPPPAAAWSDDRHDEGVDLHLDGGSVATDERPPNTTPVEPPRPRNESNDQQTSETRRPERPRDQVGRRQRREHDDPDRLVEALLDATERLYGVRETGTAVAGHVQDVVGVDAVAVLVPDGAVWSVVGATGHRHLEERLLLGVDHWLVREVTQVRHGVIVEDTDIARARLSGAPLAAWPHLLACPLPAVEGLVILARSDLGPAFTSRDLAHASEALDEAGSLFVSALAVRELARRLRRHAELDDPLD